MHTDVEANLLYNIDFPKNSYYNTISWLYYMTLGYLFDYDTHLRYRNVSAVAWNLAGQQDTNN